jgi:hypothetical protein
VAAALLEGGRETSELGQGYVGWLVGWPSRVFSFLFFSFLPSSFFSFPSSSCCHGLLPCCKEVALPRRLKKIGSSRVTLSFLMNNEQRNSSL